MHVRFSWFCLFLVAVPGRRIINVVREAFAYCQAGCVSAGDPHLAKAASISGANPGLHTIGQKKTGVGTEGLRHERNSTAAQKILQQGRRSGRLRLGLSVSTSCTRFCTLVAKDVGRHRPKQQLKHRDPRRLTVHQPVLYLRVGTGVENWESYAIFVPR